MKTPEGKIIGKHDGLMFYTLGQRKGLHIGGLKAASEEPWYVLAKDIPNNILIIGQGHDHPLLFSDKLMCTDCHWVSAHPPSTPLRCQAKTRYRQADQACQLIQHNKTQWCVEFDRPQRAVTPGQSVVFYQEAICLGGGIIC